MRIYQVKFLFDRRLFRIFAVYTKLSSIFMQFHSLKSRQGGQTPACQLYLCMRKVFLGEQMFYLKTPPPVPLPFQGRGYAKNELILQKSDF